MYQIISLVWGGEYSIFAPRPRDLEENTRAGLDPKYHILRRMYDCFGRFSDHQLAQATPEVSDAVAKIYSMAPPKTLFTRISPKLIPAADKAFILRIMKLDDRERPTVDELLEDEWFCEESEDTRDAVAGRGL